MKTHHGRHYGAGVDVEELCLGLWRLGLPGIRILVCGQRGLEAAPSLRAMAWLTQAVRLCRRHVHVLR